MEDNKDIVKFIEVLSILLIFNPDILLLNQLKGILIVGVFVFISSFMVWKMLDLIFGLSIDEEIEINGLDITETGLEAYPEFRRA